MGLKQWLARKGAVGGTARAVGKAYLQFENRGQHRKASEIYADVIKFRYQFGVSRDDLIKSKLLALVDSMVGVRALVGAVLTFEGPFSEMDKADKLMCLHIIDEELLKIGVTADAVYGSEVDEPVQTVRQEAMQSESDVIKQQNEINSSTSGSIRGVRAGLIARNEACPCESGKRYKHCCGKV